MLHISFLSRICAVHWGCTDQLRFGIMIRLPDSHGSGIFSISPTFSLCIGCTFSSIATMARRNARRGRRLWVGHSWREQYFKRGQLGIGTCESKNRTPFAAENQKKGGHVLLDLFFLNDECSIYNDVYKMRYMEKRKWMFFEGLHCNGPETRSRGRDILSLLDL